MIDAAHPITLMANSRGRITDQDMVDLAARMAMPQLLYVSQGTEGAESLKISDAAGFIAWMQANRWAARLEQDLQCISQDSEGRPILTTWISTGEFEQMVGDAQGSPFGELLRRALDMWRPLEPDEIVFDGYKAVAAESVA